VYIVDNKYTSDFVYPYVSQTDQMVFRFILSGEMAICSDSKQNIALSGEPSISYFSSSKSAKNQITYKKGSDHKMITLYISRERIRKLLAPKISNNQTSTIQRLFNTDGLEGCSLVIIPEIRNIVTDIFTTQFFGPLRKTYVAAKIQELLCYTVNHISSSRHSTGRVENIISLRDQEKISAVFRVLNDEYITPPSIESLSRSVGLNRTNLRKYFKIIHGQTIYEFCKNKRMAEAKSLLLHSDMNITQLAQYLGYNYSANFTLAFKKFYGIRPKDIKKLPRS
jgi:AraC-like DNA-binding protein